MIRLFHLFTSHNRNIEYFVKILLCSLKYKNFIICVGLFRQCIHLVFFQVMQNTILVSLSLAATRIMFQYPNT